MMLQSEQLLGLLDPNSELHFVRRVEGRHTGHSENGVGLCMRLYTAIFIQKRLPPATELISYEGQCVLCGVFNKGRVTLLLVLHSD